jgi:hypothetical protein
MGGGGGGSSISFVPYYQWYDYYPRGYNNEFELNKSSDRVNNSAAFTIMERIIPNEKRFQKYEHEIFCMMVLRDAVLDETEGYIKEYPKTVIDRIVKVENTYERVNEYLKGGQANNIRTVQLLRERVRECGENAKAVTALIERVDYYRRKLEIKREIESVIRERKAQFMENFAEKLLQQINIKDYKEDYVSSNGKIYIGLPPALTN